MTRTQITLAIILGLLLICGIATAAENTQERSFVVGQSYEKTIYQIQHRMESIEAATFAEIFDSTFDDTTDKEKLQFAARVKTKSSQAGPMEMQVKGHIHQTKGGTVFHLYTMKVTHQYLSFMNAWILVAPKDSNTTKVTMHLEVRARVPIPPPKILPRLFGRARMAIRTRIGERIAAGMLADVVRQGLDGLEGLAKGMAK